jgi:hypothetical protein
MMLARLLFATSLVAVAQAGSRDNLDNVSSKLMVHVSRQKYALGIRKAEDRSGIPPACEKTSAVPECPSRVMTFVDEHLSVWVIVGRCNRF